MGQTASFKRCGVIADADEVTVADEDGDDIVWVGLHPGGNVCKILLRGACIEQVAGGVAVRYRIRSGVVVGLALQHADAIVELVEHRKLLIGGCIVGLDKGRIMGSDEGDIAVGAGAEFRIVVTRSGVRWGGAGGCSGSGGVGGTDTVGTGGGGAYGALEEGDTGRGGGALRGATAG